MSPQTPFETYRTSPEQFMEKVEAFVEAGPKVGEDKGLPVLSSGGARVAARNTT